MVRLLGMVVLVLGLAGCVTTDAGAGWRAWAGLEPSVGRYHFDWRLSGDADLAPLQIFDDGRETWLQYPAGQAVPALFARTAAGDRLLQARRTGDYLVLRGVPDHLLMRGGLLVAEARRVADGAPGAVAGDRDTVALGAGVAPALSADAGQPSQAVRPGGSGALVSDAARHPAAAADLPNKPMPSPPLKLAPPVSRPFEVTPADGNMRRALSRWAGLAGWTFEAEHWAVDVDIPLAGSAVFDEAFRPAVRNLLAATELGDRPVQPCFYANRVLRVVPLAQRCDRTQAPGDGA
ncbi:MAG: TcpQ domain-containing protein [Castellaniella sp.]|uniref:TcpQ domain-containing protein n=1 Tax=Castellaniella sp. TaxID=1955812 RepID=UPI003C75603C